MSSYATLLDYLGDQRPPDQLTTPPGGSLGPSDPFVCAIAQELRGMPGRTAKVDHLRNDAAHLIGLILPAPYTGMEGEIMERLVQWIEELRLGDAPAGRRPLCTAQ